MNHNKSFQKIVAEFSKLQQIIDALKNTNHKITTLDVGPWKLLVHFGTKKHRLITSFTDSRELIVDCKKEREATHQILEDGFEQSRAFIRLVVSEVLLMEKGMLKLFQQLEKAHNLALPVRLSNRTQHIDQWQKVNHLCQEMIDLLQKDDRSTQIFIAHLTEAVEKIDQLSDGVENSWKAEQTRASTHFTDNKNAQSNVLAQLAILEPIHRDSIARLEQTFTALLKDIVRADTTFKMIAHQLEHYKRHISTHLYEAMDTTNDASFADALQLIKTDQFELSLSHLKALLSMYLSDTRSEISSLIVRRVVKEHKKAVIHKEPPTVKGNMIQ